MLKQPKTQSLESVIKAACDKLRRDGLTVMQYMEELSWMLFLKVLERTESENQTKGIMRSQQYERIIPEDLAWSNWAENTDYPIGSAARLAPKIGTEQMKNFLNHPETGVFKRLANLKGSREREQVAEIFEALGQTRSKEGTTLYDVMLDINKIDFHSNKDRFTLGKIYEDLLAESGKVGGFNGEYYTPRALVRFMVQCLDPKPGERIYDPAMGTGGFLICAYDYLLDLDDSTASREKIKGSLTGIEKNPSTYLLGLMNALLHDIPEPNLQNLNTLAKHQDLRKHKYDIILANPPFGSKEQKNLAKNGGFVTETPATEILFLQHFMDTLKIGGRAAIVAPNGVLFGDGATLEVKKHWLEEFNVHTILRLPNGVFSPYTDIPTNIIFFDRNTPTTSIWYYALGLPEGYKKFTKTKPLRDEQLEELRVWWLGKSSNSQAWQYDFRTALQNAIADAEPHQQIATKAEEDIKRLETQIKEVTSKAKKEAMSPLFEGLQQDLIHAKETQRREAEKANSILTAPYNLDRNHPDRATELQHIAPEELLETVFSRGERILEIIASMRETLRNGNHTMSEPTKLKVERQA